MDAPDLFADDDESPGWTLIETALAALYPDQEPLNFGPILDYEQGGPDPLEATAAYRGTDPRPHWHFVTFGFSELHAKVSEDPELSGFGFELTLRVPRAPRAARPPRWPLTLLQSLARYVFDTGNAFDEWHHMDLAGPLVRSLTSDLHAVALRPDPALPPLDGPHGRVKFLQVVGLTADELDAVRDWDPMRFLGLLEPSQPGLLLDPGRGSALEDPALRAEVQALTAAEGSSQEAAFVTALGWSFDAGSLRVELDVASAPNVVRLLRGRTLHGREFVLVCGEEAALEIVPGPTYAAHVEGDALCLSLTDPLVQLMLAELAGPGVYTWDEAPGFVLELRP